MSIREYTTNNEQLTRSRCATAALKSLTSDQQIRGVFLFRLSKA